MIDRCACCGAYVPEGSQVCVNCIKGAIVDMKDAVNPDHYKNNKFECIDVLIETQGKDAVMNFCLCNVFKYLYRHNNKNGVEDIKKAKWYLDKYIELQEKL